MNTCFKVLRHRHIKYCFQHAHYIFVYLVVCGLQCLPAVVRTPLELVCGFECFH
jgi:hypothetical protein